MRESCDDTLLFVKTSAGSRGSSVEIQSIPRDDGLELETSSWMICEHAWTYKDSESNSFTRVRARYGCTLLTIIE